MKNTRHLIAAASVLLLVGAGCAKNAAPTPQVQVEVEGSGDVQIEVVPTPVAPAPTTSAMPVPDASAPPVPEMIVEPGLTATVSITAGGTYSPATITVKKGTKITWTNAGSSKVWVASDPHPAHNGYPGFDSGTDLRAGESYSFTFDKTGSWGYHNHLNPSVRGTVVVE